MKPSNYKAYEKKAQILKLFGCMPPNQWFCVEINGCFIHIWTSFKRSQFKLNMVYVD